MSELKQIIDITLRVTGEDLNPSRVSQALSMEPDRQWVRGESVMLHGDRHSSPRKSGLWAISYRRISKDNITEILESLAKSIIEAAPPLNEIPGWESTSISINIGFRESGPSIEWILNTNLMALLASAKADLALLTY
jgi:hypothetical protein